MGARSSGSKRITKRTVDALRPGEVVWDNGIRGFGVRRRSTEAKFYLVKYRFAGRQRWFTIGQHGAPWTAEQARNEAKRLLGEVAGGRDPAEANAEAKRDLTVAELCDLYVAEGCATKSPTTLASDRGRIERHIKPLLGRKLARSVTRGDIERFMIQVVAGKTAIDVKTGPHGRAIVKGGKGTAAKAVSLLGAIFSFAVHRGLRLDNPAHGIRTHKSRKLERFLSSVELARLGEAVAIAEEKGENPSALAAIRLLALTGCRRGEVLSLRWQDVDFEGHCLRLPQSKTGAKVIPIGAAALQLLGSLPRLVGNKYVLPGARRGGHFTGLPKVWSRVRDRAGLADVRIHDLRHSFASVGAAGGDSLLIIGRLLGHTQAATTQRYSHLSDDPLKAAADRIAGQIASAMQGAPKEAVEIVSLAKRTRAN